MGDLTAALERLLGAFTGQHTNGAEDAREKRAAVEHARIVLSATPAPPPDPLASVRAVLARLAARFDDHKRMVLDPVAQACWTDAAAETRDSIAALPALLAATEENLGARTRPREET